MNKRKLYGEVIDGQDSKQDGDDDGGDQHAQHQNEHGLDECEKSFDASFYLTVQYIRQLQHHGTDAASFLPDADEIDGQGFEDARGGQGLHHPAAFLDDRCHARQRLLLYDVTHSFSGNMQRGQHGHAVAEQGAKRA